METGCSLAPFNGGADAAQLRSGVWDRVCLRERQNDPDIPPNDVRSTSDRSLARGRRNRDSSADRIDRRRGEGGCESRSSGRGRVEIPCVESGAANSIRSTVHARVGSLSRDRVLLDPGESEEIRMAVRTVKRLVGTHGTSCRRRAELCRGEDSHHRTRLKGTKAFVTVSREGGADPLVLQTGFGNTGNTQRGATRQVQVVNYSGAIVRIPPFEEVGATALGFCAEALVGSRFSIRRANVVLEFGVDNPMLGVRAFPIRQSTQRLAGARSPAEAERDRQAGESSFRKGKNGRSDVGYLAID